MFVVEGVDHTSDCITLFEFSYDIIVLTITYPEHLVVIVDSEETSSGIQS